MARPWCLTEKVTAPEIKKASSFQRHGFHNRLFPDAGLSVARRAALPSQANSASSESPLAMFNMTNATATDLWPDGSRVAAMNARRMQDGDVPLIAGDIYDLASQQSR